MTARSWRNIAEHEAAHAVVAAHFGMRVTRVVASGPGNGYTQYEQTGDADQCAAVRAAGDTWGRKLGSVPYIDLACADLARFERDHGLARLWQAERAALDILTARRDAVAALADRIERERTVTFAYTPERAR
ncbi:hypothetical protein ABZ517_30150 [Streptomyces scabiei]|uniref:hypothetical protein n=1 Tax=Streptomyces scabiei TaxID=1930 RepID=UPI003407EF4A